MRTLVHLVPPCYLPGGVASMAWAADDGAELEVYISELIPKAKRPDCVRAATGTEPGDLRVLHLTT